MNSEKVVLSFIAIFSGLLVAFIIFFIYQSTKSINPAKITTFNIVKPTPTPKPGVFLTIDTPSDQTVTSNKSTTISGRTNPDSTIVVNTADSDQVISPSTSGNYSVTVTLNTDENLITLTAIEPDGNEISKHLTVTYSTEDF